MGSSPTDLRHARHDWTDNGAIVATIVAEVADATNTPVAALPSLYRAIPPDALEALLEHGATAPGTEPTIVSFEYVGHTVIVDSDGDITIRGDRR